jgi:EAL domain-containing protein (putative c-di-GMP-specific phosphodiesterase class I)
VGVGVDDFGTGYSSLGQLRRFPVDTLKVDGSFVEGLGAESGDSAIVAAVINLAHTLGLLAVAEGVETEEQAAALRQLGCDAAQGFLFAPPMHPSQVSSFVRSECATPVPRGA